MGGLRASRAFPALERDKAPAWRRGYAALDRRRRYVLVPDDQEDGVQFVKVDPEKGTREPAFDHVRLAAALSARLGHRLRRRNNSRSPRSSSPTAATPSVRPRGGALDVRPDDLRLQPWRSDANAGGRRVALSRRAVGCLRPRAQPLAAGRRDWRGARPHGGWGTRLRLRSDAGVAAGLGRAGRAGQTGGDLVAGQPPVRELPDRSSATPSISTSSSRCRRTAPPGRGCTAMPIRSPATRLCRWPRSGASRSSGEAGVESRAAPAADAVLRVTAQSDLALVERGRRQSLPADARPRLSRVSAARDRHRPPAPRAPWWKSAPNVASIPTSCGLPSTSGSSPMAAQVIWYGARDGWGHLYLYDTRARRTAPAAHRRPVQRRRDRCTSTRTAGGSTSRPSAASRAATRTTLTCTASSLDGSEPELLTPEDAAHAVSLLPPAGTSWTRTRGWICRQSRCVRGAAGEQICELERADIEALLATGWQPPERFSAKARDGVTDVYGAIFRPSRFDANRTYPVIDNIYGGPQVNQAPTSFADSAPFGGPTRSGRGRGFWHAQALAELGFVVVMIDGLGMPGRAKAYQRRQLSQPGRRRHAGPYCRPAATRRPLSLPRPQPRRHFRPLGRRLRLNPGHPLLPRLLQSLRLVGRQPRPPARQGRLGRALHGLAGRRSLPGAGEPIAGAPTAGQAAPDPSRDGRKRSPGIDHGGRRRAHQGEQGLRPADPAEPAPLLRLRSLLRPQALGLLRPASARRRAAGRIPDRAGYATASPARDTAQRHDANRRTSAETTVQRNAVRAG